MKTKVTRKKDPGRPRAKNSTNSFSGWGLEPEEDQKVIEALTEKDISAKQLVRALLRQWLDQSCPGSISFNGSTVGIRTIAK